VTPEPERRAEVFERELWRIAVEHLDYGEQHVWAALAGARVAPNGWRRAKAMLHFDRGGELKRRFLLTAVQRNRNPQLRLRALQEIAASRDAEAFDSAIDMMGGWPRDERREGVKIMLQALAERRIGRRDQANAWIWRMAEYTREVHEEYAVQRWPETKRLLGLLVNSSGSAHARNARRLVHASRKEDRRLSAALLAAALAHTPEAEEALRGARTRMARKPAALARELLRNFPKGRRGKNRRRRKSGAAGAAGSGARANGAVKNEVVEDEVTVSGAPDELNDADGTVTEPERDEDLDPDDRDDDDDPDDRDDDDDDDLDERDDDDDSDDDEDEDEDDEPYEVGELKRKPGSADDDDAEEAA
jgi:ribonuclease E